MWGVEVSTVLVGCDGICERREGLCLHASAVGHCLRVEGKERAADGLYLLLQAFYQLDIVRDFDCACNSLDYT